MTSRILLAGLGNRGRTWAEVIAAHADARLAAAVDISPAAREAFAAAHPGVPVHARLEDAIARGGCDAVLLATPPDGHLAQARAAVAARLPMLIEKPLSLDLAEAAEIVRVAEAARVPLAVGLNFRFLPVSLELRALLAARVVGEPGFARFTYERDRDGMLPRLNRYPLTMRHPMMLEQSIHHLDLMRFCYGREASRVVCRTWNPSWSMYAHDSNVSCLLSFAGGLEVDYLGTWTGGWRELRFEWRTDCRDGVLVQRQLFSDLAFARRADAALTPVAIAAAEPFRDDSAALLAAFVAALAAGTPPPCGGRDHLRTLALCFAALESAATGAAVDVPAFERRHGIAP